MANVFIIMKEEIIFYSLILCIATASFCFLYKLMLWLKVKKQSRVGFISSFVAWFSVHDIHNASSNESKKFRSKNNNLNFFFLRKLILFFNNHS